MKARRGFWTACSLTCWAALAVFIIADEMPRESHILALEASFIGFCAFVLEARSERNRKGGAA